ncbi:MAG TPA: hypothetical protein VHA52_07945 [Candidatus Babeliaceae bacterium]|nr:hypothetical protein [Candidatus Babeliaceae bacterium]
MKNEINKELLRISEEMADNANQLMDKIRDWQVIKNFLTNRIKDITLTPEQEKKLQRYQYIYNQQISGAYTDQEIVTQVKHLYGIEQTQAYEDINHAREIFNSVVNIHKQFELKLQLQINRQMLNKALELGDMKAWAAIEKNRIYLIKQLHDEPENVAEFFEGHIYELTFDPHLIGAPEVDMKRLLNTINAKRNRQINTDMFEDAESEEIKDD